MRFLRLMQLNGESVLINPNAISYAEESYTQTYDGNPSTRITLRGERIIGEQSWPIVIWVKETLVEIECKLEGYRPVGGSEVRNGDEFGE